MQFSKELIFFMIILLAACQATDESASPSLSFGQTKMIKVSEDSLIINPNKGLVYYQNRPFTGTSISYFTNGKEAVAIDYVAGKKHGLYQKWFEHGLKSFESQYVTGKKHGKTYTWWRNGKIRSESTFEQGVAHGIQYQWYISGAKFKNINLAYGKEEGLQQSWRENGKLYNNYEAKNGRIFGLKRSKLCYTLEDEEIQYKN